MVKVLKEGLLTFKSIFTGMGVTWGHLFEPAVTLQYPEERAILPDHVRNQLFVNIEDCIGCNLCARACPVNCIEIETVKATVGDDLGKTSTGNPKRLWVTQFNIDLARCMYCELCVHPCPTECIYMTSEYEYSEYNRNDLNYKFSNLTPNLVEIYKDKAAREAEKLALEKEEARLKKEKEKLEKESKDKA
ncbi:MAG: NADH-quinone oxidoreductase subunit I [Balneolales bacterium]